MIATPSPSVQERLRALSRCEHDDLSIGDEAADEIDRLTALVVEAQEVLHGLNAAYRGLKLEVPYDRFPAVFAATEAVCAFRARLEGAEAADETALLGEAGEALREIDKRLSDVRRDTGTPDSDSARQIARVFLSRLEEK